MKPLVRSSNTKHHEERCRDSDRLQHPAGSAGLWNPQAPSGGAGDQSCRQASMERPARKTQLRSGPAEFFNDPKLTSLIDQALAGNQQSEDPGSEHRDRQQRGSEAARGVPSLRHVSGPARR